MPQRKLLLDTNAYLRLARSIYPLLFIEFGDDRTCLYLTEEVERELNRSRRLRSKFRWVDEPEYREIRQVRLQIGRKQKREIRTAIAFIGDQADANVLGVSPVDVSILGHAYVLEIGVVTDDTDMQDAGLDLRD